MANDVCYSEIEGDLISIRVEGLYNGPDILVWGKFDKKSTRYFQWSLLEEKLNSEYRKVILLERDAHKKPTESSIHQLLFEVDDIQFHHAESKYRYAMIDFNRMMSMVRQRPKLRFNWKQFKSDLTSEVDQLLANSDYKMTAIGPGHFVVSINRQNLERDFLKLKAYIQNLENWRYFSDDSALMKSDITPDIKLVSPSSVNLVRLMEDGPVDIMEKPSSIRSNHAITPSV